MALQQKWIALKINEHNTLQSSFPSAKPSSTSASFDLLYKVTQEKCDLRSIEKNNQNRELKGVKENR